MISQGFRTYDIEANDFPISFTASTDASKLPNLPPVTFRFQDGTTEDVTTRKVEWVKEGKTAKLVLKAPSKPCNVVFAVVVRFPASNPLDKPVKLLFESADNQKAKDDIFPESLPIVFANYVMQFREED